MWNALLLKAISVSYAHFLISYRETTPGIKEKLQKALKKFYEYFPTISSSRYCEPWLSFAKQLYVTLYQINAPVLAKLLQYNSCSIRNANQSFVIGWYKLCNPNSPDKCFFKNYSSSDLCNALTCLGMNLIDTPYRICEQFRKADTKVELCEVSNRSILKYYCQFSNLIYNHNPLPCALSSTKFRLLNNFIIILNYLMHYDSHYTTVNGEHVVESIIRKEFPMLGLVVTADENLHSLSNTKNIISSAFWSLFPNSCKNFIHDSLLKCYPFDSSYLWFNNIKSKEQLNCLLSVIAKNLPSSWNPATQASFDDTKAEWMKDLFNCLVNDPLFCKYYNDILKKFPLLPASDNMVYSASSMLLPLKTVLTNKETFNFKGNIENVEKLMMKLQVPLFRQDIISDFKETIEVQLPSVVNAGKVLESLYLVRNLNMHVFQKLDEDELKLLFEILKMISYSSSAYQNYIRTLPIFTTIDKKLVSLDFTSDVWIWNDKEVCTAGMDIWINSASSCKIFLSPSAPWACLMHEAKNL